MDGKQFDDLIRQICTTRLTRMGALRGLTGAVLAPLIGAVCGPDATDAKGKHKNRNKHKNKNNHRGKGKGQARTAGDEPEEPASEEARARSKGRRARTGRC